MAENIRIAQLIEWLRDEPEDVFLQYALAMEYRQAEPEKALSMLEDIAQKSPDYTATYYHLAAMYVAKGEYERARATYAEGIAQCRKANDRHALAELQRASNDFEDWLEDEAS
jgi:predicted Zn-dependent protease